MYETTKWDCPTDATKYEKIVEKKRIYKLLSRLNKNIDEVRGRLLARSLCLLAERLLAEKGHNEFSWRSALAGRAPPYPTNDNRSRKGGPCSDHCQKPGHTKDTCWKIHGKPAYRKPSRPQPERDSGGNNATTKDSLASPTNSPFSKHKWKYCKSCSVFRCQNHKPLSLEPDLWHKKVTFWLLWELKGEELSSGLLIQELLFIWLEMPQSFKILNLVLIIILFIADGSLSKVSITSSRVIFKDLTLDQSFWFHAWIVICIH